MRFFVCIVCILLSIAAFLFWVQGKNDDMQNESDVKKQDVFIDFTATKEPFYKEICTNLVLDKRAIKNYYLSDYSEKNAQKILLNHIKTYYK